MDVEKYASLGFFEGLSRSDLASLLPFFASSSYVAGTIIFEQGDQAEHLYLVVAGEVTIRYKPDDGPVMTVTHVQPGGIFGWSAATGNSCYTSSAVCSLDSELLYIGGQELRQLFTQNPRIGNILAERLSLVIAERKRSRQWQVNPILVNGAGRSGDSGGA